MRYSPLEEMESALPQCFMPAFASSVSMTMGNKSMAHAHICKLYTGLIHNLHNYLQGLVCHLLRFLHV